MAVIIVFKEQSYKILGACFEVYKEKGNGFLEAVYQECLVLELIEQGIPFVEKPEIRLDYKGRQLKQTYQPDFLCFGEIIACPQRYTQCCGRVEIKAVKQLSDEHRAQVLNYLKSTDKQLGLLINFGLPERRPGTLPEN